MALNLMIRRPSRSWRVLGLDQLVGGPSPRFVADGFSTLALLGLLGQDQLRLSVNTHYLTHLTQ
jgi:hypothetical protein